MPICLPARLLTATACVVFHVLSAAPAAAAEEVRGPIVQIAALMEIGGPIIAVLLVVSVIALAIILPSFRHVVLTTMDLPYNSFQLSAMSPFALI